VSVGVSLRHELYGPGVCVLGRPGWEAGDSYAQTSRAAVIAAESRDHVRDAERTSELSRKQAARQVHPPPAGAVDAEPEAGELQERRREVRLPRKRLGHSSDLTSDGATLTSADRGRMTTRADLLANVERPEGDRPARTAPSTLPDVSPWPEPEWAGPVNGLVEHWKLRALRAERHVERLLGAPPLRRSSDTGCGREPSPSPCRSPLGLARPRACPALLVSVAAAPQRASP
jgi:hypothetical protein